MQNLAEAQMGVGVREEGTLQNLAAAQGEDQLGDLAEPCGNKL